jgi:hypothetical protein
MCTLFKELKLFAMVKKMVCISFFLNFYYFVFMFIVNVFSYSLLFKLSINVWVHRSIMYRSHFKMVILQGGIKICKHCHFDPIF